MIYIKGAKNIVADALSRLRRAESMEAGKQLPYTTIADHFGLEELPEGTFPLRYSILDKYQQKDQEMVKALRAGQYQTKTFRGGGKEYLLITQDGKIVVPKVLQQYVLNWYHTYLLHPGANRTEECIRQHLTWPGLREDVRALVTTCDKCQRCKKQRKKYGLLPPKEAETIPWEWLCVDLVGPYKIKIIRH